MDRIGIGQDSHKFSKNKKQLVLGGVVVSSSGGLDGNSDADVVLHSLCNALSSAIGGDSISTWSDDMLNEGIRDSSEYVRKIVNVVSDAGYKVANVSISVEAKKPRIELSIISKMKEVIAKLVKVEKGAVGITFTSGDGLNDFGKGLGIGVTTVVLLKKAK
jgi:2-C-methyl-D-erythritol 2,4-cyclodiphosphate synthase